jgi:hypothetical protein
MEAHRELFSKPAAFHALINTLNYASNTGMLSAHPLLQEADY